MIMISDLRHFLCKYQGPYEDCRWQALQAAQTVAAATRRFATISRFKKMSMVPASDRRQELHDVRIAQG